MWFWKENNASSPRGGAPERAPGQAWKCGALERAWAWKCGAPKRAWSVLSVKMPVSGTARTRLANPRRCRTLCVCAEPAVGGDERVEIKEFLKMMVSGMAKSVKKCKMVMLRNRFFFYLWKWYAPERKFRAENRGLALARHINNKHTYGNTPRGSSFSLRNTNSWIHNIHIQYNIVCVWKVKEW